MKIKNSHVILILIVLTTVNTSLFAQSSAQKIQEQIGKIASNQYQNPSAGKLDLFHLLEKNPTAPDSCKGYIYMTLATSFGMLNLLDSGLWAADNALKLYSNKDFKKAYALRTKAILYRLKGEYEQATLAIKACLHLNDSIWKNQSFKAVALQEYASLCNDQNNFYQATSLYLEALDVVNSPNNKDENTIYNALKIEINLAEAYAQIGNHGYAIQIFEKALPQLDSLIDYDGYIRTGYQLAESYIQTSHCKSSDSLVGVLLPIARQLKNEELESYLILKQGISQATQNNFLEALTYYRQAFKLMDKNHSAFILECAIPYLTALKTTGGSSEAISILNNETVQSSFIGAKNEDLLNFKKIAIHFLWNQFSPSQLNEYYQNILHLSDTVMSEGQKQMALELQAKYQFEQQEKNANSLVRKNELLRKSEGYKRKQMYLIILIAAFLFTTIVLFYLRVRQRSRIQAQELDMQKKENEIQKQQTAWAIQEKNYRDQMLEQQKIVLSQTLSDSDDLNEKMRQLVDEQAIERRKELLEHFEKAKDDKMGLEKLLVQFNSIHPSFVSELHNSYPKLSQSDLQYCILYRMNISTKEIASLLHVEHRSIYAKKYRIMEKMELGKEDDFNKIIFGRG